MLHKDHVVTNGVGGGLGSETSTKVKIRWTPRKGQPHMRDKLTIKGSTLVANSRGTLVNHHCWNMGTPRQEVKTHSSGLPDIKKEDT